MLYGFYLSTSGMLVQQHRNDVIANNLANAETTSFKRDVAIFRSRAVESATSAHGFRYRQPVLDRLSGGVFTGPTYTEFTQGEFEETSRDLDVAITGPGFLAVQDTDGQVRYTRDGRFTISPETKQLAMLDGRRLVLDRAGQPIQLDDSLPVAISSDGAISQAGQVVTTLGLTDFGNVDMLRKIGENLYDAPPDAAAASRPASLVARHVERSTTEPVKELVAMISAQRAYEANARMIQLQDESLAKVVNDLARVA